MSRPTRSRLWLVAGSVVVIVGVIADFALGSLARRQRVKAAEDLARSETRFRRQDSLHHHDLVPLASEEVSWAGNTYSVRTNSWGFRDASNRTVAASDSAYRLLLIGDSMIEGIGQDYANTVAGRLAARLKPVGGDVLNAAVASYAPTIYWKKLEHLLDVRRLRVDEIVVFIDMSDVQDELLYQFDSGGSVGVDPAVTDTLGIRTRRSAVRRFASYVKERSLVLFALRAFLRANWRVAPLTSTCAIRGIDAGDGCRGGWSVSDSVMTAWGARGLARATEHMDSVASLARRHRVGLTIAVFPWPQQLLWNDRDSRAASHWAMWSKTAGVRFVNLFPAFFEQADARGGDVAVETLFLRGDVHWSAAGSELVADQLFRALCGRSGVYSSARRWLGCPAG